MYREAIQQLGRMYQENFPFPHIDLRIDSGVLPGIFPGIQHLAEDTLSEWPNVAQIADSRFDNALEKKFAVNSLEKITPSGRALIDLMNSPAFIEFLEALTGIKCLVADPAMIGGGYHEIPPGGKLGMHIDFARHSVSSLYRRVNVLLYLNKGWRDNWGGELILMNEAKAEKRIKPRFGTMVVFSTTASSWHGHPEPLSCPPGASRKSIALYYYTVEPGGSVSNLDTKFMENYAP